jgi:hypothetical protein
LLFCKYLSLKTVFKVSDNTPEHKRIIYKPR